MIQYRVEVHLEVEISARSPEDAAFEARERLLEQLRRGAELRVSHVEDGAWEVVGYFTSTETRTRTRT